MAGKYFDKSIKVSTGFGLSGKSPLDTRTICNTLADRDAIPNIQLYEGIIIFVEATGLNYQYINNAFVELSVSKVIDVLTSTSVQIGLSANQGRVLKSLLDTHKSNGDAAGSKHIPAAGASGQKLIWSATGVAQWANDNVATAANQPITLSGPVGAIIAVINNNINLPGSPTTTTQAITDDSIKVATTAFTHALITQKMALADAMTYKGVIDGSVANQKLPAGNAGNTYKVSAAGTISTIVVHIGDILICKKDATPADSKADWDLICNNEDGKVIGPVSAVGNNVALFDGSTGKLIKDSGISLSTLVPKTLQVIAGSGLTGGGALGTNITLNIGQGVGIEVQNDTVSHQVAPTVKTRSITIPDGQFAKIIELDAFGHIVNVTGTTETQLSCPTGVAEAGKYISAIGVSGHLITVTKSTLPAESGKVKLNSSDTADYVVNKIVSAAAAALGVNEYAINTNVNAGKLELSVVIGRIDGGYYDA